MSSVSVYHEAHPSNESYWRAVVLFGKNVASYKFALAKALLQFAAQGKTHLTATELAVPYSQFICNHLQQADRQGISSASRFLDACRNFNQGKINQDALLTTTANLGFNNVLDAFHVINGKEIANRFFVKQTTSNTGGIILTDNLFRLKEIVFGTNLGLEVDARWRLVETAWDLAIPTSTLKVEHDIASGLFYVLDNQVRRKSITSVKHALNGYQKGKCFYCFADINVADDAGNNCEVDHFFPHRLQPYTDRNLNGVWNLVLSCQNCNRGESGKHGRVAAVKYLERLDTRNSFLVKSHHPLRETIMAQTGISNEERRHFLQTVDQFAIDRLIFRWDTPQSFETAF